MTSLRHCIGVISFGSTMIRIGHVHYNTENREQRTANSIRQSALLGALPPSFLDQREILCSIGLLNWIPITSGVM
jgi:hypothetical protein